MTKIFHLGTLTTQTNWQGGISAARMLDEGFIENGQIDDATATLDDFFVTEDVAAEARCIDGRCNSHLPEDHLGAQVPGGTPGAAIAFRLMKLGDDLDVGNFIDDTHEMLERSIAAGFVPGDHRDQHGHGIGCGAIDKMDAALAAMVHPELIGDHKRLVRMLLGADFSDELYMQVLGACVVLEGRIQSYMSEREKSILELEEYLHHSVSILEGEHHECLVVINLVPGTTFATKRFSDDNKGMQAFNYDFWRTLELAEKVYENVDDRHRFIMARVMTAVATLMVLTDGSQHLLVRTK